MLQDRGLDSKMAARDYSLPEVHHTVATSHSSFWRRLFAFAGPAYLVSVGYMDPGNWATDLEGGARFGYRLLWVLVLSNVMALLLQTLSSRLGIVTRRDLAQACREEYPRAITRLLWILCEIAIVACDLAEVLGAAIGLNLLFHIPLLAGVVITAFDTLLVLWFTHMGIRVIEAFVLVLIATIAGCFAFEILLAQPDMPAIASGLMPRLSLASLYISVAILGATVMPHNLYLHSALVQTRQIGHTYEEKREACRFNFLDSAIALNGALFVNAAILVVAAAVFFKHHVIVTEIAQAHQLLSPLLGTTLASVVFGAALLCSGQSSTLTGTMAGQIVMEGFLQFRMQPWLRRALTRCLAVIPAAFTIYLAGSAGTYQLIILSQVVISFQLPFAVIPLIHFTGDKKRMGRFANGKPLQIGAWLCAAFIVVLNVWLIWYQLRDLASNSSYRTLILTGGIAFGVGFIFLLAVVTCWPWLHRVAAPAGQIAMNVPENPAELFPVRTYSRILVPLDHSDSDREALSNAVAVARTHNAEIVLLHVEEGVTSRMFGALSSTAEIAEGQDYLAEIVSSLRKQNIRVTVHVKHGGSPAGQIAEAVRELVPDLLVMASHGHTGLKDLIFGTTINAVRHRVKIPLLIVRAS